MNLDKQPFIHCFLVIGHVVEWLAHKKVRTRNLTSIHKSSPVKVRKTTKCWHQPAVVESASAICCSALLYHVSVYLFIDFCFRENFTCQSSGKPNVCYVPSRGRIWIDSKIPRWWTETRSGIIPCCRRTCSFYCFHWRNRCNRYKTVRFILSFCFHFLIDAIGTKRYLFEIFVFVSIFCFAAWLDFVHKQFFKS